VTKSRDNITGMTSVLQRMDSTTQDFL